MLGIDSKLFTFLASLRKGYGIICLYDATGSPYYLFVIASTVSCDKICCKSNVVANVLTGFCKLLFYFIIHTLYPILLHV